MTITLWGSGTSRTMRAHWALAELGVVYQQKPIGSRTGETQDTAFRALNPKEKIPVLVDDATATRSPRDFALRNRPAGTELDDDATATPPPRDFALRNRPVPPPPVSASPLPRRPSAPGPATPVDDATAVPPPRDFALRNRPVPPPPVSASPLPHRPSAPDAATASRSPPPAIFAGAQSPESGDSIVLTESAAIVTYLGDKFGGLTPVPGSIERARYYEWMSYILMELDAHTLYVMRKHGDLKHLYGEAPAALSAARAGFEKQIRWALPRMESAPFLVGDEFGAADILMTTCLDWAVAYGFELAEPALAYRARHRRRPAFRAALAANAASPATKANRHDR